MYKLENILVPKHEVLSGKDTERLLEFYNVTRSELPKIRKDDPALKGLGAKVGDIIKITRKSPSAGTAFYYRVVIEG
ncbi:MAG: DNA-directed RNA polymerase subunit H [Candidatus Altiarchaeales archaeon]|nr:MAG: DNA-directed RNA polymerase subunit H [Candidatus Altiarchaeales archaeon]